MSTMRNWLRDHGLLLANVALFVVFFVGMALSVPKWEVLNVTLAGGLGPIITWVAL